MRVSFVIQDMFAQGAQYATALMVRGFVAQGYDVDLIVSGLHKKMLSEGRTNVFEVPEKTNWIYLKGLKGRQNLGEIRHYLKTTNSVAVISMCTGYTHALRLASIGLRKRPLLVHVEHSFAGITQSGDRLPNVKRWSVKGLFSRWYYKAFDRVFVVSQEAVADFARMNPWYPKSSIRVVNNPVIDKVFREKVGKSASHEWLKDAIADWKTFVNAAALHHYKGQKYLLEAMRIIAEKKEKIRVVIFGEGYLRQEFESFILKHHLEDYVSLPGYTTNFPAEAKASHGFVLSSLAESFGIVLVEALAAGCKMVSFDCPFGPREILDGGKYGRLVTFKDSRALAEALIAAAHEDRIAQPDISWNRYTIESAVNKYKKGLGI